VLCLLALVSTSAACDSRTIRPNVLLYVVDTLRADSLAPYGNPLVPTPAAVRLAREGVLYERAYTHSSWTRPSVTSILTGQLPDVHGVEGRSHDAPQSLRFLGETLADAGYATGAIVTNPNVASFFGFDQGWNEYVELFVHSGRRKVGTKESRARSDEVTKRAIEWIDRTEEPFFLFILTTDPHTPYEPPEGFDHFRAGEDPRPRSPAYQPDERLEQLESRYLGEVAFNDYSLGQLLDHLRALGLYDRTLVVLSSDHGEEFGEHGYRWHGRTLFEEQLHVPLIIRRPHESQPGRRVSTPVRLVDTVPTVLQAAGLPVPEDLPGVVLPPEGDAQARVVYARLQLDGFSSEALVRFPWKLIQSNASPDHDTRELGGLFNLVRDPFEAEDLREERPEIVAELQSLLEERRARERLRSGSRGSENAADQPELPAGLRSALEVLGYLEPAADTSP
jgi:arylsulfatase